MPFSSPFQAISINSSTCFATPAFYPVPDARLCIVLPFGSLLFPWYLRKSQHHFCGKPRFPATCPRNDAIIFASFCYSHFNRKWYQFLRPNVCLFRKCTLLYFLIPFFSPFYHSGLSALALCVQALEFMRSTYSFASYTPSFLSFFSKWCHLFRQTRPLFPHSVSSSQFWCRFNRPKLSKKILKKFISSQNPCIYRLFRTWYQIIRNIRSHATLPENMPSGKVIPLFSPFGGHLQHQILCL